jgi:hypothetical protein
MIWYSCLWDFRTRFVKLEQELTSNISGRESLLRQIGVRVPDPLPLHVPHPPKALQNGERVLDLQGLLRVPTLPKAPRSGERVLQE